jgi:hypothetical protein
MLTACLIALTVGEDEVLELVRVVHPPAQPHGKLARERLDAAAGQVDVLLPQGAFEVADGEIVCREPGGIDPEAHRVAFAAQFDVGHARDGLHPLHREPVDELRQLQPAVHIRPKRNRDHRVGVRIRLGNLRVVDLGRNPAAHAGDLVAHVVRGLVHVAIDIELERDPGALLARTRPDDLQAVDRRDFLLDQLGDLGFDDLGGRTRIRGVDRDRRRIRAWVLAHRQPAERQDSDEHDQNGRDEADDRPLDGNVG